MIIDIIFGSSVLLFIVGVVLKIGSLSNEKPKTISKSRRAKTWVCVPNQSPQRGIWSVERK
jgi:hypothetical protein